MFGQLKQVGLISYSRSSSKSKRLLAQASNESVQALKIPSHSSSAISKSMLDLLLLNCTVCGIFINLFIYFYIYLFNHYFFTVNSLFLSIQQAMKLRPSGLLATFFLSYNYILLCYQLYLQLCWMVLRKETQLQYFGLVSSVDWLWLSHHNCYTEDVALFNIRPYTDLLWDNESHLRKF